MLKIPAPTIAAIPNPVKSLTFKCLPKEWTGYIDQGAEYIGDTSHSRSWTKPGNRGSLAGQAKVTSENVTGGMGGKFWKEPEGF